MAKSCYNGNVSKKTQEKYQGVKKKWGKKKGREALCPKERAANVPLTPGENRTWHNWATWGRGSAWEALVPPSAPDLTGLSLSPRSRPTHPLPERGCFPWLSSLGGCREVQLVHIHPISAHDVATSRGREIIRFCSFPAHKHKP